MHVEQVLALALERERAKLVSSLRALDARTWAPGEAQAEEFAAGGEPADVASDLNQQEVELTLARVERGRLALVDAALQKLADGRYGTCEECGSLIGLPRLRALPWAQRCRRCVEQPRPVPIGRAMPEDGEEIPAVAHRAPPPRRSHPGAHPRRRFSGQPRTPAARPLPPGLRRARRRR
jgi:RNA polymerase-binding transcription factor DksA